MALWKLGILNAPSSTAIVKISGVLSCVQKIMIKEADNVYDCLFDTAYDDISDNESAELRKQSMSNDINILYDRTIFDNIKLVKPLILGKSRTLQISLIE